MTNKSFLTRTAIALILGIALVVVCYFFVDRPVAWFVHTQGLDQHGFLRWPTLVSDWLKKGAPPAILFILLWWLWKPGGRLQSVLLAVSASLIVTTVLKQFLKWGCGRYWPETWKKENPSLIGSGAYGFHPFHGGVAYESFPSGHAAITCAVVAVLWLCYPRWRWLYAIIGGCVCVALVGMNYHFVGDVVAGATVGSIVGVGVTGLFRLNRLKPAE
jgi:membrane-associated phospholipid phosphatase